MNQEVISFKIDGKECLAERDSCIVHAAAENNVYIPTLCNYHCVKPKGSCRICTVNINGKPMTACTTPLADGMEIENNTPELNDLRLGIIELLFAEGNHLCPSCQRSGTCELQALAYRYRMTVPRFPYLYPRREVDATHPKLIKDQNRCIFCKRCVRAVKDDQGRSLFAYSKRGHSLEVTFDKRLAHYMTDEQAENAAEVCPVGSILRRKNEFETPVGARTYDKAPIGSDIEA